MYKNLFMLEINFLMLLLNKFIKLFLLLKKSIKLKLKNNMMYVINRIINFSLKH
jgi:hypothetical protein